MFHFENQKQGMTKIASLVSSFSYECVRGDFPAYFLKAAFETPFVRNEGAAACRCHSSFYADWLGAESWTLFQNLLGEEIKIQRLSWRQKMLLSREIRMKCRSFHENGYLGVNETELLNYLLLYRWKNQPKLSIKECKYDIVHLQPNDFFDYQQLIAQTRPFELTDWKDIEDLL